MAHDSEGDCKLDKESLMALGVKTLAEMYGSSAERIGSGGLIDPDNLMSETTRYQKGLKEILDLALKITDENQKAAALRTALDYCMKAKDYRVAMIIADDIAIDEVQDSIAEQYSQEFVRDEGAGKLVALPTMTLRPRL
jgi:hypothetical protein